MQGIKEVIWFFGLPILLPVSKGVWKGNFDVGLFRAGASAYLKAAGDVHGTVTINISIGKFTLKPAKYIATLIMVNSVGHTNELVSRLENLGIVL